MRVCVWGGGVWLRYPLFWTIDVLRQVTSNVPSDPKIYNLSECPSGEFRLAALGGLSAQVSTWEHATGLARERLCPWTGLPRL